MIIENIRLNNFGKYFKLEATVLSENWKYCDNIVYYSDTTTWSSDSFTISGNIKKMCRREWYKLAKANGISRKELNIRID